MWGRRVVCEALLTEARRDAGSCVPLVIGAMTSILLPGWIETTLMTQLMARVITTYNLAFSSICIV